jgi:nucleoside-diphosphate-sugar epimerase
MKYKKILVLGSSGQIGKDLCNFLSEKEYDVIQFDIINDLKQDLRIENVLGTIIPEVDFVFFLAFDVGGSKYLNNVEKSFEFIDNNCKIMVNTFNVLKKYNKPFIFTSSQMSNMTYSSYGVLKSVGEYYTKSLNGVIVKFWNVYGVEDDEEKSHVITDFINMTKKGLINMRTNGDELRQFLHSTDCSEALELLMNKYDEIDRNKNLDLTSFEWTSIEDIAKIISKLTNSNYNKGTLEDLQKDKQNEPDKYILNFWTPKTSIELGIKKIIESIL